MKGFRVVSLCLAYVTLGGTSQDKVQELPPWLQVNEPTLERLYGRGIADAGRGVRPGEMIEKTRRSLGQIDPNPLRDEAESSVWLVDPYVQAYLFGWHARHDDWSPEQLRTSHEDLVAWGNQGRKRLTFQVVLNLLRLPPAGRLTHPTAPAIFRDVQVELKVAGRRYEPLRQPGDLALLAGTGSITSTTRSPIVSPVVGVASGPGEISTGGAAVTNYFTVYRTDKYEFYQGNFTVVFDLYDANGAPRVRPKDVAVSAIVLTAGGNEHEAKYGWSDLMAIRV